MIIELVIGFVLIVGFAAIPKRVRAERAAKRTADAIAAGQARARVMLEEARAFFAQIESDRQFPALEAPLLNLPLDEFVVLHEPQTPMRTFQTRQVAVGQIGGFGGVGARPREWRSDLDTHLTTISAGDLYLTNRRLIFMGDRRSMSLPWRELMALKAFPEELRVDTHDNPVPIVFNVKNSLLWAMLIKWMHLGKVERPALAPGAHIELNPAPIDGTEWIINAVLNTGDPEADNAPEAG